MLALSLAVVKAAAGANSALDFAESALLRPSLKLFRRSFKYMASCADPDPKGRIRRRFLKP